MRQSIIYLAIILSTNTLWAQFNVGIGGLVLTPQDQFKKNIDDNGFGLSITGAYNFEETPFSLGLNIGGARYGSKTRSDVLVWPVSVDIKTTNDIFFMHLMGRAEYSYGFLTAYSELLFGFNYLFTSTAIEDREGSNALDIASDTHFDDIAISYGFTTGSLIKLFQIEDLRNGTLYLDLKMKFMFGGEAKYLKEGDLKRGQNNEVVFNSSRSEIDYISYQIGLVFKL